MFPAEATESAEAMDLTTAWKFRERGEKTEWKFQYVRDALNFLSKLFSSDWIGIVHIHIGKGNPRILLFTDCLKWSTGFW